MTARQLGFDKPLNQNSSVSSVICLSQLRLLRQWQAKEGSVLVLSKMKLLTW